MKKTLLYCAIFASACTPLHSFAATAVGCTTNSTTGAPEATSPWRNTLGQERADAICRSAAPTSPQPPQMTAPAQATQTMPAGQMGLSASQRPARLQPKLPDISVYAPGETVISSPSSQPAATTEPVRQAGFAVSPADANFRSVLTRWSTQEGWVFKPEHWTVGKDIPVGGSETMLVDYKSAVRRLLESTLLTDTAAQPCFYSNRVLRVIPATELCSRSKE